MDARDAASSSPESDAADEPDDGELSAVPSESARDALPGLADSRADELTDEDSPEDEESEVSAYATPGADATAQPTPSVTASAPTRPTLAA
ncbi:hypothetical protein [Mycolicibacterium parafortuitum]|uniref:hypothetical protein n=1 Tax=Mycolicibacterium parafortuitum TaxID=39692 RepID=UPI001E3801CC|nr:hypothetical protein [Mycolicibacterium parafortuitum]